MRYFSLLMSVSSDNLDLAHSYINSHSLLYAYVRPNGTSPRHTQIHHANHVAWKMKLFIRQSISNTTMRLVKLRASAWAYFGSIDSHFQSVSWNVDILPPPPFFLLFFPFLVQAIVCGSVNSVKSDCIVHRWPPLPFIIQTQPTD